MKRCPKCNRTYEDDTLRFCLEDGAALVEAEHSRAEPPRTEILYDRTTPTLKVSGPTNPSFPQAVDRPARNSNPLLTVGVIAIALLLLVLVGIAAFFVLRQPGTNQTTRTNNSNEQKSANRNDIQDSTQTASTADTPAPGGTGPSLTITASASSIRLAVQANTYYAANAMDGKRTTAWIEGADGPGLGEWIRFDFDREVKLHRISIQPGYFKSPEIWRENNRLASATAYFSDGNSRDLTFSDRMESQKTDIGSVRTRWVRLVIKDVYYGKDPDTAISEVAFEWEP